MTKLTDTERTLLANLHAHDPNAEFATNLLAPGLTTGLSVTTPAEIDEVLKALNGLARKKLVGAEGRGKLRGYWIEPNGLKALEAAQA